MPESGWAIAGCGHIGPNMTIRRKWKDDVPDGGVPLMRRGRKCGSWQLARLPQTAAMVRRRIRTVRTGPDQARHSPSRPLLPESTTAAASPRHSAVSAAVSAADFRDCCNRARMATPRRAPCAPAGKAPPRPPHPRFRPVRAPAHLRGIGMRRVRTTAPTHSIDAAVGVDCGAGLWVLRRRWQPKAKMLPTACAVGRCCSFSVGHPT